MLKLAFRIQKLRFGYKYSVVSYKDYISVYIVASRFTIELYYNAERYIKSI